MWRADAKVWRANFKLFVKFKFVRARWKKRPGVPKRGVPGCGKRGVWWKTLVLVENAGSDGKHENWHGGKRGV